MICTFFGHRDAPGSLRSLLKSTILELIAKRGITLFYVGNNGNFDYMVQNVLEEIAKSGVPIEYYIVLSTPLEKAIGKAQHNTIFPEGLEKALPRYAISKRNDWLIERSDFAITYVRHTFSNAYKLAEKAKRKGLEVINICIEKSNNKIS